MKSGSASVPIDLALRTGSRPSPTLVPRARSKVGPGPRHPNLSPPSSGEHDEPFAPPRGPPVGWPNHGGNSTDGGYLLLLRGPGRSQEDGRRLRPTARARRPRRPAGPHLTFGTMTDELLELVDWLAGHGVVQAALESTGVFWRPVSNLLEARFSLLVVNAQHIKQVPGRKTDVKDCQWIAQWLQHGLLRPSFVPPRPIRAARPDPAAHPADPAAGHAGQPPAEGPGGRQHQAGRRGDRHPGGLGPGHDPGPDRWRVRPGPDFFVCRRPRRGLWLRAPAAARAARSHRNSR